MPGWGVMLDADRVLAEMVSLGIDAAELGAPGFLPRDPAALRAVLDRHGVAADRRLRPPRPARRSAARAHDGVGHGRGATLFAAAGATTFVSTAVVDDAWAPRFPLSAAQWDHLVGMLAELDELCAETRSRAMRCTPTSARSCETRDDVREVLERSAVRWCLDTGHLLIGGYDPAEFAADAAGRIAHVHVKDVRARSRRSGSPRRAVPDRRGRAPGCSARSGAATLRSRRPSTVSSTTATTGGTCSSRTPISATHAPPPGEGPVADVRASARLPARAAGRPTGRLKTRRQRDRTSHHNPRGIT